MLKKQSHGFDYGAGKAALLRWPGGPGRCSVLCRLGSNLGPDPTKGQDDEPDILRGPTRQARCRARDCSEGRRSPANADIACWSDRSLQSDARPTAGLIPRHDSRKAAGESGIRGRSRAGRSAPAHSLVLVVRQTRRPQQSLTKTARWDHFKNSKPRRPK